MALEVNTNERERTMMTIVFEDKDITVKYVDNFDHYSAQFCHVDKDGYRDLVFAGVRGTEAEAIDCARRALTQSQYVGLFHDVLGGLGSNAHAI
jgi:hypothetical protein